MQATATRITQPVPEAQSSHARTVLARRLADIVCLPSSRITPVERHMAGDLLVGILGQSPKEMRKKCAGRIAPLIEVAPDLIRFLVRDDIDVAQLILKQSNAVSDVQLVQTARAATLEHRIVIARRKGLSELVCEALLAPGEPDVAAQVLQNSTAHLSHDGLGQALELSREYPALCPLLLKRPELRPAQGLTMFWWSNTEDRRAVLTRFAVGREIMQDTAGDIFAMMAKEDWQDTMVRKSMQFIERRQRNREAIDKSVYSSLENAVDIALEIGVDSELADEMSYLSGIKPVTGAKIINDHGGEALAVLCKATGLKRDYLVKLWRALNRPVGTTQAPDSALLNTIQCFDSLSSNKAQTVLRYWNWALNPDMIADTSDGERAQSQAAALGTYTLNANIDSSTYAQWGDVQTPA